MIPIGQIAAPDTGLKILTPWWDVLARYLTAGIMTIALTATAIQAVKDNLICTPAVDCSEYVKNPSAVWNKSLPDNSLLGPLCSLGKPILNSSRVIVTTTMSDRRQYDYVDSVCFQKVLPWFPAFFPFILFGEAVLILLVDNIWSKMPSASSALNHFVSLVMDCYNSEGTLSDILKEMSEKEDADPSNEALPSETPAKFEKEPLVDTADEGVRTSTPDNQGQKNTKEEALAPSVVSNAAKIKSLYEKVDTFKRRYKSRSFLLRIYATRAVLQSLACVGTIVFNFLYYSSLKNTFQCELKEVFITKYEFFNCSQFIAPFYRGILIIFAIPVVMCFCTSFYCLWWMLLNSRKTKVKAGNFSEYVRIRGDMSLLFFLLMEYDKLYSNRLAAFLSKEKRKTIERNFPVMYKSSLG